MAEDDKKTGVGEEAQALADKLTNQGSAIYLQDDRTHYKLGETFPQMNGISSGVLKTALEKTENKTPLNTQEKATLKVDENLLKLADASTKTKPRALNKKEKQTAATGKGSEIFVEKDGIAYMPLARIVEAANQHYAVGDETKGNKLLDYAIKQAELIEKRNGNSGSTSLSAPLKEYKTAVDEYYKGEAKEKEEPQASKNPDMKALAVAAATIKLPERPLIDQMPPTTPPKGRSAA